MEPVDKAALEELKSIMGDEFDLLIDIFLSDSAKRIIDLESAIAASDAEALRTSAHSFKGSSLNISAANLTEYCKQLESMGKNNTLDNASEVFEQVKQEFDRVKAFLGEL